MASNQSMTAKELGEAYRFAIQLGRDAGKLLNDALYARRSDPLVAELLF